jgi:hypothetical protein
MSVGKNTPVVAERRSATREQKDRFDFFILLKNAASKTLFFLLGD